jgi:hypothetical protein
VNDDQPPNLLADMLRAIRRGEPWVIALIAILALTVTLTALLWLATHHEPQRAPAHTTRHLLET